MVRGRESVVKDEAIEMLWRIKIHVDISIISLVVGLDSCWRRKGEGGGG